MKGEGSGSPALLTVDVLNKHHLLSPPYANTMVDYDDNKSKRVVVASTKPHFFKPLFHGFLHRFVSRLSAIPKSFRKYLGREQCCEKAVLRRYGGNQAWHVTVDDSWHFKDGWEGFAKALDLHVGDFLVFMHRGSMLFDVLVFEPSACLREYPSCSVNADIHQMNQDNRITSDSVKSGKENIVKTCSKVNRTNVSHGSSYCWIMVTRYFLETGRLNIPKKFSQLSSLAGRFGKVIVKDQMHRSWSVMLRRKRCDGQVSLGRGMRLVRDANGFKRGDVVVLQLVKSGNKAIINLYRIPYANQKVKDGTAATLTHRHYVAFVERCNLEESYLRVPKGFAQSNGLKEENCEMIFEDQKGCVWPVLMKFPENQAYFGCNWNEFAQANDLKQGDAYMLELINTRKKLRMDFYSSSCAQKEIVDASS
ncbi:hypothetical protein Ancab_022606 [Ancistrocladus abbreviatus]